MALNRGNVPDTMMILLAVLAADATATAVVTGRRRPVLLAGIWVGLAFQAKMIEAWLVLPAVAACYLLAAPGGWAQRVRRAGAMCLVAAAVSLSWITAVTLLPASVRPYVDGGPRQLALPAGLRVQRIRQAGPGRTGSAAGQVDQARAAHATAAGLDRLLAGALGRDTGWLLAAALIAFIAGLAARRGQPRGDPVRACLVLWGTWLTVLTVAFSVSSSVNSYYTAALSPAVAALTGTGLALAWEYRDQVWTPGGPGVGAAGSRGIRLLAAAGSGTGLPSWLKPALAGLALAAACCLATLTWWPGRQFLTVASITLAALAALIVPAVASVSVVSSGLGPFETPFEPQSATASATMFFGAGSRWHR